MAYRIHTLNPPTFIELISAKSFDKTTIEHREGLILPSLPDAILIYPEGKGAPRTLRADSIKDPKVNAIGQIGEESLHWSIVSTLLKDGMNPYNFLETKTLHIFLDGALERNVLVDPNKNMLLLRTLGISSGLFSRMPENFFPIQTYIDGRTVGVEHDLLGLKIEDGLDTWNVWKEMRDMYGLIYAQTVDKGIQEKHFRPEVSNAIKAYGNPVDSVFGFLNITTENNLIDVSSARGWVESEFPNNGNVKNLIALIGVLASRLGYMYDKAVEFNKEIYPY